MLPGRSHGTQEVVDCLEDAGAAATLEFKMNTPALGSCTAFSAFLRSSSRIGRSYTTVVDKVHDGHDNCLNWLVVLGWLSAVRVVEVLWERFCKQN